MSEDKRFHAKIPRMWLQLQTMDDIPNPSTLFETLQNFGFRVRELTPDTNMVEIHWNPGEDQQNVRDFI